MKDNKTFERICPNCNAKLTYKYYRSLKYAEKHSSICASCSNVGKNNPFYNKHHTNEHITKLKINNPASRTDVREKISKALKQYNKTSEHRKKLRLAQINNISIRYYSGNQISPNYNISSIPILNQVAKELGITDLQHAENGGEFYIKELGYWVDGYSKEKNIVIEYYEKHHNRKIEKDLQRQKEITNLLKCEFIIIKE